jgi:restriction system protein
MSNIGQPERAMQNRVIALEDDQRIRRALAMVPTIVFYRYQISFKLVKV